MRQRALLLTLVPVALVLVVLVGSGLDVRVPQAIHTEGRILPAQEWILVKGRDGALQTVLYDRLSGTTGTYTVSEFERGDAVRFHLDPSVTRSRRVAAGDTIGSVISNQTELRLAQLAGELASARAALALSSSGQKASVVEEAERRVAYAREQLQWRQQRVERLAPQHDRGFVSTEEFEEATTALRLDEVALTIAEAELASARSGERPEQLELDRTRAESLEREMETLQDRRRQLTMISPVAGEVRRGYMPDTLLIIADPHVHVVFMPVRWQDRDRVREGQHVRVRMPHGRETLDAVVVEIDGTARPMNGQSVVIAVARIDENPFGTISGLMARCSIDGEAVGILPYLRRLVANFLT